MVTGFTISGCNHVPQKFLVQIDTWDYQSAFGSLKSKSLVVRTSVNLTENLRFGLGATHAQRIPKYMPNELDRVCIEVSTCQV